MEYLGERSLRTPRLTKGILPSNVKISIGNLS